MFLIIKPCEYPYCIETVEVAAPGGQPLPSQYASWVGKWVLRFCTLKEIISLITGRGRSL
ncbi:hypothetical protein HanIR_Chr16g0835061 [Helianthus annuus]|nr:hypothetical protein HanIR_Chr16g0835061 [Helianthus annuus]